MLCREGLCLSWDYLAACSRDRTELKIEIHLSFGAVVMLTRLHCDICYSVSFSAESPTNKSVLVAAGVLVLPILRPVSRLP